MKKNKMLKVFLLISIVIVVSLLLYLTNTLGDLTVRLGLYDKGSRFCQKDGDCISKDGLFAGCWSEVPHNPFLVEVLDCLGPHDCICYNYQCSSASKVAAGLESFDEKWELCSHVINEESRDECYRKVNVWYMENKQ
jgi:hypothetical protein